jgi:hypothetical protein
MNAFAVVIDQSLVANVSPVRGEEWRSLAADLADAVRTLDERVGRWDVTVSGTTYVIRDDLGRQATVARADLATLFDEYLEVIGQLGATDAEGFSRVDALDMAKKVTHDRAGRVIKRSMRELEADHEVARRVFSLLVALTFDTTAIDGAHAALSSNRGSS